MRLILGKEARAKPVDCVQYRVPGENIADPIRHHSRHVENSGTEVQCAGQLRPNLVPRFEEPVDDGIDESNPATKQRDSDDRTDQCSKIVRQDPAPYCEETSQ